MSDRMRLSGMYSGMDTDSIISQLVAVRQTKVTKLKGDQTKLEWKQKQWQDLNSKIYSLYSSTLSNLRLAGSYQKKTTTCSDTTKATVVASEGAVNGTQTLEVSKLAKAGYLTGAELAKKQVDGKEEDWKSSDKLSDMSPDLVGSTISVSVGGENKDIEITEDMTISSFVNSLKEVGVNASFDEKNQRFFISSKGTGESKEFTLAATDKDGNTTNDVLKTLGVDENATYNNGSVCKKIKAQDAEIVLNGATFKSDTNTFSVNGLTITATGETDGEITINTTNDYEGVYNTIKDFISEYNDLIIEMDKLYNADSARKYNMLTDEEKEAMTDEEVEKWEDTIKDSLLRKDMTLSTVMNTMTSVMSQGYEVNGKTMYLFDFGINTLNYFEAKENERKAYHIDGDADDEKTSTNADKLKKAIAEDPEGTAEFFSNICKTMYEKLDKLMQTTEYSSVYKVYNDKQLKNEYDDYTKKIKEEEQRLADYEDKWYDKFSAMEVALSKLQSNSNAVTSMLAGM